MIYKKRILLPLLCAVFSTLQCSVPAGILKFTSAPFTDGQINDVKIDSNGKIVAAGYGVMGGQNYGIIARFNTNGNLDTTFNTVGYVVTAANNNFAKIVFQGTDIIGYSRRAEVGLSLFRYSSAGVLTGGKDFDVNNRWALSIIYQAANSRFILVEVWGTNINNVRPSINLSANDTNFFQLGFYGYAGIWSGVLAATPAKGDGVILADGRGFFCYSTIGLTTYLRTTNSDMNTVSAFSSADPTGSTTMAYVSDTIIYASRCSDNFQGIYKTDASFTNNGKFNAVSNSRTDFPYGLGGGIALTDATATTSIVNCGCDNSRQPYIARFKDNGSLDTDFNTTGVNTETSSTVVPGMYQAVALMSNGKAIAAGFTTSPSGSGWVLARYNTNGTLDTTFTSTQGVLQDTASPFSAVTAGLILTTTIDQSGKLLAGGNSGTASALIRYNTTGTPRNSSSGFGTNGVAYNSLAPTATINKVINAASNGYLVAAVSGTDKFTTALYANNGTLNGAYGSGGIVQESLGAGPSAAYDMLLNGASLAVCGYAYTNTPIVINYNSGTGARDTSIGRNGIQEFSYLVTGTMYGITSVGTSRYGAGQGGLTNNVAFLRLLVNSTGVLQDTLAPFDTGLAGLVTTTTIDQSGKLMAGGNYGTGWALIRYNTTGTPRNSSSGFGTNGVAYNSLVATATINKVINAASNGYLVAAVSGTDKFTTALYANNGTLNGAYGSGGIVQESLGAGPSAAYDMLLNGGSLAVCGYAYTNTPIVINYNSATGARDTSIGRNGTQEFAYLGNGTIYGITAPTGGSRYGAGQGTNSNIAFLRLLVNGTGVLQDTLAPFDTGLAGLVMTTTMDQSGKLLAGGNYGTNAELIRYNVTGSPRDTTFNSNGVGVSSFTVTATINKVINSGTGYLVAGVGGSGQFSTALYANDGTLNTAYNTTGVLQETGIGLSSAYDMLLNGTALGVCGYAYTNTPILINYNSGTGARDTSLGSNGVQQFAYLGNGTIYGITAPTGGSLYGAGQGVSSSTAFLRLLVNGTGILQDTAAPFDADHNGIVYGECIDALGNITLCGSYNNTWMIVKYTNTAARVTSFNGDGVVLDSSLGVATAKAIIQDDDGNYYVAGESTVNGTTVLTVAKYSNVGQLVTSFGTNGIAQLTNYGQSRAMSLVLTAGNTLLVTGQVTANGTLYAAIAAYTTEGQLIERFGTSGVQTYQALGTGILNTIVSDQRANNATAGGQTESQATLVQVAQVSPAADFIGSGL